MMTEGNKLKLNCQLATRAGVQPADIFVEGNDCNLYLTTKHVFENFGRKQLLGFPPAGCRPEQDEKSNEP